MPLMQAKLLRQLLWSGALHWPCDWLWRCHDFSSNTAILSVCSVFSPLGSSITTGLQQGSLLFSYLVRP